MRDAVLWAAGVAGQPDAAARAYTLLKCCEPDGGGRRRREGAFYTPSSVASLVADRALAYGPRPRSILDPAMGTGVFLLEAARLLSLTSREAETVLHGVERDPLAAELALLLVAGQCGARPFVLRRRLLAGDALRRPPPRQFDLVVGNPPWGGHCCEEEREWLREAFPAAGRAHFDSFKPFVDLSSTRARLLGMVLPQAVLSNGLHADVRSLLLERLAPREVISLGGTPFPDAVAPACALIFGPRPGPAQVRHLDLPRARTGWLAASEWTARTFPVQSQDLLRRLQATHPALGAHVGFRIRDTGINYNRASVARNVLYSGPRRHPRDVPRYRGRDFGSYTPVRPGGWLRHDAVDRLGPGETLSLDWDTYRREKIVFRQTADRIVATLDTGGAAMGRSVIALTADPSLSLRALLACLNSRLWMRLYRSLVDEEGRVLPQVKVRTVRELPLPSVASTPIDPTLLDRLACLPEEHMGNVEDPPAIWACLDVLVRRVLTAEGAGPLDLIDSLVERLYGLLAGEAVSYT